MKKILIWSLAALCCCRQVKAQAMRIQPSTQWYEEAKYGLFLHFGLYSIPAGIWEGKKYYGISEWIQKRARIPVKEYAQLAARFNPSSWDADAIVKFAKDNGFRYIVYNAKFHDGFAMYGSRVSPFNIVDATPYGKDPLKELADACKKQGMKLGFYYSQSQDWYEADAVGNDWDFKDHNKNFQRYLDVKCKPQLEELLTRYGEVAILWFDTPQGISKEESQQLADWVHSLQPGCLTTSRLGNGLGEYLALRDHELPKWVINRPFEALFTHNESWGYSTIDRNFRSPREILHLLISSNTRGGNLIFSICPDANGKLQQESVNDVSVVGRWLRRNGEAIYGTTASPFPELAWGGCTAKPGCLYFHVMEWPAGGLLRVPVGDVRPRSVTLLASGKELHYTRRGDDLLIQVPLSMPDSMVTVIKMTYEGTLQPPAALTLMEGMTNRLLPEQARFTGRTARGSTRWMEEFGDWHYASYVGGWQDTGDKAVWNLRVPVPGRYHVVLEYGFQSRKQQPEGNLRIGDQEILFQARSTGDQPRHFFEHRVGAISVGSGNYECTVQPLRASGDFIRLRTVKLLPYR